MDSGIDPSDDVSSEGYQEYIKYGIRLFRLSNEEIQGT